MGNTFNTKRVTIENKIMDNKMLQLQKDTVKSTISLPQMSNFNSILIKERLIK